MTDKQMINREEQKLEKVERALPLQRFTPDVDIYESEQELVVLADLPGVTEQDMHLEVERGILTLEAEQAAVEGVARKAYYRQFKLSERIDADAGTAELKDGVLQLRLPKTEAAKPKRIEVKTLH
ncbi:Molecular chaperone IbpA, HSP20 family [Malonomonas rubra DSM 5091]|uniref:Molecular chaperone IbpA, HSP20 family n=1 Tax=Malonomonas rubra DSM 5091 TaxID=1122189 RepID=A0A1M6HZA7_MALRU|nr:Hsp20/alpha crystallin family protein [Malonomonas rubra]SHJ27522.1 Molecular chaperone IbpA, HSP20 family [Malonomonas rubra DSM 5091]